MLFIDFSKQKTRWHHEGHERASEMVWRAGVVRGTRTGAGDPEPHSQREQDTCDPEREVQVNDFQEAECENEAGGGHRNESPTWSS